MWQPASIPFTIKITEPEKKSKFKGMKSYISYQIQPSVCCDNSSDIPPIKKLLLSAWLHHMEEVISDRQSSPFFISYLWSYLSLFCLTESLRLSFYFLTKFSYLYRNLTDHSIAPGGIRTSIKERPYDSEAGALSVKPSTHSKSPQFVSNYTKLAILYKRWNSQLYWFP